MVKRKKNSNPQGEIMETFKSLKLKALSYFISEHGAFPYKRDWYRVPICPFCGRSEKFGLNPNLNRAHCFRCDYDDKLVTAVTDAKGLTIEQTKKFLDQYSEAKVTLEKYEVIPEREVILPEGFKTLSRGNTTIGDMARNYIKQRGFNIDVLTRLGVGYTDDPDSKYWGYLIVPFKRDHKVVYYQTRRFFGTGPKFKNPSYEDFGIGKTQILYNERALSVKAELNIFESWTNGWTLGTNFVSLNGKIASPRQWEMIVTSKATLFNIMLDLDAWNYAVDLALSLILYRPVRLVRFSDDRDVNQLGKEETLKILDHTEILTKHSQIIKLKNKYGDNIL